MIRLKEICKEQGITLSTVSERTGIFTPSLSRVANGGNTTTEMLSKIAAALNVSIVELFEQPKKNYITCPKCGEKLVLQQEIN